MNSLFFSLALALLLRLPSFFEPYSYADEGIYLVLGQAFRQGLVFYRDIHDNKPPLLYLAAALAGSLTGFRVLLALVNGINVWLVWLLARQLFAHKPLAVWLATAGFTVLTGLPWLEGNIANGEIFMILPLTAAALLIWQGRFWPAGLLATAAFLFKVPAGFDLAGLLLFLVWKGRGWLKAWLKIILPFAAINLAVLAYYYWQGAGQPYLNSALLQNLPYLFSWGGGGGTAWWQIGLIQRLLAAVFLAGGIFLAGKRIQPVTAFLGLWLVFSLYGVLLSERPYPHYWLEVAPVLALIVGWAAVRRQGRVLLAGGLVLAALAWIKLAFWSYPVLPYYRNFFTWASGHKSRVEFERFWGQRVIDDRLTAAYIRTRTDRGEPIYVWGTEPGIYYLSGRLPVGRYTVSYHVADFNGYEETMAALALTPPRLIVRLKSEKLPFPELDGLLAADYVLTETIGDRLIYLRLIE